jgi:hypothetical protein
MSALGSPTSSLIFESSCVYSGNRIYVQSHLKARHFIRCTLLNALHINIVGGPQIRPMYSMLQEINNKTNEIPPFISDLQLSPAVHA